ncbi:hypothetical protein Clacol_000263 [Clathrus columnatus]|uniref:GH16 domain-containing protein n=1 Tax=Clathrus columnatus TaxID=1419009 RepID=A0AAV4ZWE0_9AGAM|nr:hypothetical protein Clacol_000263 [Clathrus columnatus]
MARPPRQSIPSFYLNRRDSDDDFYGTRRLVSDTSDELADNRRSTSDVFADPPSSTDHSSFQQQQTSHSQLQSDPSRFPLSFIQTTTPSNGRPGVAQQIPSAPSPVSRQRIPPPSAYIEPRPDSPASVSRGTDESYFPRPEPPFLRENARFTSSSRSSSAHSFAPAPQLWSGSVASRISVVPSQSGLGSNTPPPAGDTQRARLKRKPKNKFDIKRKSFTSNFLKEPIQKPWLQKRDKWATLGQWLTRFLFLLGICAAGAICYLGAIDIPQLGNLCLVMDDNFDSLDTSTWLQEVKLNGLEDSQKEFQWFTSNSNNSFVQDGKLYIVPTLTSDVIGREAVFNGFKLSLQGCTAPNSTDCSAVSNNGSSTVINPVQSAALSTRKSVSIQYGKVEVTAKMPQGDWLWPAISMFPVENSYGSWPLSGEIDIAMSRGNGMNYPAQGNNFVSSALTWGPTTTLNSWFKTFGWIEQRRASFANQYRTYTLEWNQDFMQVAFSLSRFYIDKRTISGFQISFQKKSLLEQGNFPSVITDGVNEIALPNPWKGRGNNAPFDQPFYLVLSVGVGGQSGWFPDGKGNKPWFDQSATAMHDFALDQDTWFKTWPEDITERAMIVASPTGFSDDIQPRIKPMVSLEINLEPEAWEDPSYPFIKDTWLRVTTHAVTCQIIAWLISTDSMHTSALSVIPPQGTFAQTRRIRSGQL